MNDGVIIEDGHGSRKSFIAEFHRATSVGDTNDGSELNAIHGDHRQRTGGTVEAILVAEVVRIVDGHGMVRR